MKLKHNYKNDPFEFLRTTILFGILYWYPERIISRYLGNGGLVFSEIEFLVIQRSSINKK